MNGMEMMLMSMMKNLGIDPNEIVGIVKNIGAGVTLIDTQQKQIIAQQRVISDQLTRAGFGPVMLPQPEDITYGDGQRSPGGDSDGGTNAGA